MKIHFSSPLFIILLILVANLFSSCAWLKSKSRGTIDDESTAQVVPKEQYEQLLVKYEELSKDFEDLKNNKSQGSLGDELVQNSQVETVDVMDQVGPSAPAQVAMQTDDNISKQLLLFQRAVNLKTDNPSEATKIFQQIESYGIISLRALSKLHIGEMLMEKGYYDVALQSFEDIINRYASSGAVLGALRNASVCTDKLGLKQKQEQYSSMLRDVFEAI